MSRRGENIYKRKDGRWEGRYPKGRKENGRLYYGYVYAQSYKKVKEQVIVFRNQYQVVRDVHGEYAGSLSQWLQTWLIEEVKERVKLSTFASYQHKLQTYVVPHIGHQALNQLTSETIQGLVDSWRDQHLSATTIQVIFQVLQQSLATAVAYHYLLVNPCETVRLPKKKERRISALSVQEQSQLEHTAQEDALGLPVLLALHTGLRMGELSALQWQDIDLDNQLIRVKHTYQRVPLGTAFSRTQLVYGEAKTKSSIRVVPFSVKVKQWLLKWQQRAQGPYLFMKKQRPMEPRLLTYYFKRIKEKAQLPSLHFHQLRHTFATRCMEGNSDVAAISALLGHASAKTTLDVYTDALLDQRRTVIQAMEGVVC